MYVEMSQGNSPCSYLKQTMDFKNYFGDKATGEQVMRIFPNKDYKAN
jgi:hypothetical protein